VELSYDYERACMSEGCFRGRRRVALPLAAGGGLPPMALTFISYSIPCSRRFWERYAAS